MKHIFIQIINSCLWCEKEIPFVPNKLICSMKCLKALNKTIKNHKFFYDKSDVINLTNHQGKR